MKTDTVKGFQDFTGEEALKRTEIKQLIGDTFLSYGFEPAETPIVEYEEFVKGENENDEAVSDIFKLRDKGGRELALRYEFTFQLKRIAKNKKLPYKRFQIGPVFRDEPISANRLRQFTQCDIDIVGSNIKSEAEILFITKEILNNLKVKSILYVNNRKLLDEILADLKIKNKDQVLREIDKLDKLPKKEVKENLKKLNADKILNIFDQSPTYFKKYPAYKEIEELKKYCKYYKINIVFAPFLTRGLSYYNGNVFEIKSNIKETICAGGSYIVNGIQSTGISLGIERLQLVAKTASDIERVLVVSLNQDKEAIQLAQKLRTQGMNTTIFYGKPSKALEYANSYNIKKTIFVGAKEVQKKKFKVKDMKTGKEKYITIQKVSKKNVVLKKK
mgnify:FL=1